MNNKRLKQGTIDQVPEPDDLQVWQHPVITKAVEVLEVFSVDPGDGMLAASLVLVSDQLIKYLQQDKGELVKSKMQAMSSIRDSAYDWLRIEVASEGYPSDPRKSTVQIDRAINCALLLLCAQILQYNLPLPIRKKAYSYITHVTQ